MARTNTRRPAPAPPPKRKPFRPLLLAGGIGLIWFVEFHQNAPTPEGPSWSYGAIQGVRLLADFVGAWLFIATAQLLVALVRAGLSHLRTERAEGETS